MVLEQTTASASSAITELAPRAVAHARSTERRRPTAHLSIAMFGTRGVPAAYGGFETAVEEVGYRLVERGHRVTVYTRGGERDLTEYRGMRVVQLPALSVKQLETLSHTGFSVLHAVTHRRPDAAFVFNAANSPFIPMLRARGIPVALHMDGLEWRRSKWGRGGAAYYRWAEEHGVRAADALIADAPGIAEYYEDEFQAPTELIRYGAPILNGVSDEGVRALGLESGGYHLVVARFEPENHVLEIVKGYRASAGRKPLIVVGSAPYAAEYTQAIAAAAQGDERIRMLGGVYDQELLDALYAHAFTYVHGHSVGGTNPSLLRAMGAGTAVIAYDVTFNREVLDDEGWFFFGEGDIAGHFAAVEAHPDGVHGRGEALKRRAEAQFRWDDVADAYEDLALRLAAGESAHSGMRRTTRSVTSWSTTSS
ncbi:DUF1972 domain-containing protein [Microbacterium wangruii]|uniref:DUF1972 domain-containing protein n=2 Tax=Microbacteriaceae TaxID=85023 RepID=UPI00256F4260|nr:DUF1972 domain-containing protein [Microbacterium sp. zg-Y1211]MDL5487732.1 DUF1972 domain-containing protein [Microbacterium sp. zg-Y1211]